MIWYVENPNDVKKNKNLLELINEFGKAAANKGNMQKSAAFLCTNNEKSEKELIKTIPPTIESNE